LEPDNHTAERFGGLPSQKARIDMIGLSGALAVKEKDTFTKEDDPALPEVISTVLSNNSIRSNALGENRHMTTHVGDK
jgi:hypothetical protein